MRILTLLALAASPASADDPTIVEATAQKSGSSWTFSVTLAHEETGWDDYADGWRVEDAAGNELGQRVLHHPHANEQPFTRSQSGIVIPEGVSEVYIRARTNVDGWGKVVFALPLE